MAGQGILVSDAATFAGGIVNTGKLGPGPASALAVCIFWRQRIGRGITNSGTITASQHGIVLQNGDDFEDVASRRIASFRCCAEIRSLPD